MRINFSRLKDEVRGYETTLLMRLLPHGNRQGREYVCLNPTRHDSRPGSFKINLRTFAWADFATGDKGRDVISLWAYVRGINNLEAAKEILTILGKDMRHVRT